MANTATRAAVLATLLAGPACTIQQAEIPSLAGPSDFALSLSVAARPDLLASNGSDTSVISITARDHTGAAKPGVQLRVDPEDDSNLLGTLSSRNLVTGSDGTASVVFVAPAVLPARESVTIFVSPVGTNQMAGQSHSVLIRLVRPQVITAPGAPTARFGYFPALPKVGQIVQFSGAASTAAPGRTIVRYVWNWGDGETASSAAPNEDHDWLAPGLYRVTLTVHDDLGRTATWDEVIQVVP